AVAAGAGNRREGEAAEILAAAAQFLKPVADRDLAQLALRRRAREPGEEPRQRRAVAAMRGARAVELGRVLARFRQKARIGGAMDRGPARLEPVEHPGGGRAGIGKDALALEA